MCNPSYLTIDELLPELRKITDENVELMRFNIAESSVNRDFMFSETWTANNMKIEQNRMKIREISLISEKLRELYQKFNIN